MTSSTPLIYLDLNVVVDAMNNRAAALSEALELARQKGARFAYSPAHIEEIANIYRSTATDSECDIYISEHLRFIAALTDCLEIFPAENGPAILKHEHPVDCMRRVVERYELTYVAECNEETLRAYLPASTSTAIEPDAFTREPLKSVFAERLYLRGYERDAMPTGLELRNSHTITTALIDICFRSIHHAGIGLENKSKTRSGIHDVTHAIYAVPADIFVSGDARMLGKVKASYRVLQTQCIPLSVDEFLTYIKTNS